MNFLLQNIDVLLTYSIQGKNKGVGKGKKYDCWGTNQSQSRLSFYLGWVWLGQGSGILHGSGAAEARPGLPVVGTSPCDPGPTGIDPADICITC